MFHSPHYPQIGFIILDFNYKTINGFVEKRTQYSEFGGKISEWETDVRSIFKFYRTLKTDFTSYIGENP